MNNKGLLDIQEKISTFREKGWTEDRLVRKGKRFEETALYELLEPTDEIGEITEDRIEIKKRSGQVHYYEKRYGENRE